MLLWCVALFGAIALVGCSDSDDTTTPGPGDQPYDGPVVEGSSMSLSTFSPNYGKYLQKVVFEGSGFTSPENMKVYFNQRPSAVIGVSADGTKFYALAPRLPGDDCVISVVQGSDSLVYNEHFAYTASTTVETLVGTGKAGQTMGSFAEAEISPYYAVADQSGNLFVASRNQTAVGGASDNHSFIRVDMVNNEVSMLSNGSVPNVPTCDLRQVSYQFLQRLTLVRSSSLTPSRCGLPVSVSLLGTPTTARCLLSLGSTVWWLILQTVRFTLVSITVTL